MKENRLIQHFQHQGIFTNKEAYLFYHTEGKDLSKNTVNGKIYQLIQAGLISRVGRGKFKVGASKKFEPQLSSKAISIANHIKQHFPLVDYSIWNSMIVKEFSLHQSFNNFTIVEIERNALEAVFHYLKEFYKQVYLKPKKEMVENYLLEMDNVIIIQHLVSEAPTQEINNIPTSTIEKMLVDLVHGKEIFYFYQGYELINIFSRAFDKYNINQSTLLRYANRRKKKEEIKQLLKNINRQ